MHLAGPVHARVAAEAEHILRGNDGECGTRLQRKFDETPLRLARVETGLVPQPLED